MKLWFKRWNPILFIVFTIFFNFIYVVFSVFVSSIIFEFFNIFMESKYIAYMYIFTYIAIYVGLVVYQSYIYSYICRTGSIPVLQSKHSKEMLNAKLYIFFILHIVAGVYILISGTFIGGLVYSAVFNIPVHL